MSIKRSPIRATPPPLTSTPTPTLHPKPPERHLLGREMETAPHRRTERPKTARTISSREENGNSQHRRGPNHSRPDERYLLGRKTGIANIAEELSLVGQTDIFLEGKREQPTSRIRYRLSRAIYSWKGNGNSQHRGRRTLIEQTSR